VLDASHKCFHSQGAAHYEGDEMQLWGISHDIELHSNSSQRLLENRHVTHAHWLIKPPIPTIDTSQSHYRRIQNQPPKIGNSTNVLFIFYKATAAIPITGWN